MPSGMESRTVIISGGLIGMVLTVPSESPANRSPLTKVITTIVSHSPDFGVNVFLLSPAEKIMVE